jgi:hypothetical protein
MRWLLPRGGCPGKTCPLEGDRGPQKSLRDFWGGLAAAALLVVSASPAWAADPTGPATLKADPNAPVNFTWTLVAAFLVFFMQAGFALLGAGLIRSKNTVNYLTKSYMDFSIAALSYWAFGFALMFGGSKLASGLEHGTPWVGLSGFFLSGPAYDVTTALYWFFQMVFAATAATIVAGAMAERTKIQAYLAYSFLVSALIYPIYGHWVWGGGWLANLPFGVGARDFAGSGVVHAVGGLLGLVGAAMVGPRIGKFNPDGTPNALPGHNMAYVVTGTFILFFGWFGFNPGSTLAATDLRISVVAVNTLPGRRRGRGGGPVRDPRPHGQGGHRHGVQRRPGRASWASPRRARTWPTWAAVVIGAVAALDHDVEPGVRGADLEGGRPRGRGLRARGGRAVGPAGRGDLRGRHLRGRPRPHRGRGGASWWPSSSAWAR